MEQVKDKINRIFAKADMVQVMVKEIKDELSELNRQINDTTRGSKIQESPKMDQDTKKNVLKETRLLKRQSYKAKISDLVAGLNNEKLIEASNISKNYINSLNVKGDKPEDISNRITRLSLKELVSLYHNIFSLTENPVDSTKLVERLKEVIDSISQMSDDGISFLVQKPKNKTHSKVNMSKIQKRVETTLREYSGNNSYKPSLVLFYYVLNNVDESSSEILKNMFEESYVADSFDVKMYNDIDSFKLVSSRPNIQDEKLLNILKNFVQISE